VALPFIKPAIPSTLIDALRRAGHVGVLTGSGISAESGVPTFRDAQTGLWSKFKPEDLCGGRLRPDFVWFGEMLPPDAIERAVAASRSCDLFLSVGTSTLVHPAASLPFEALERGAIVVEINPDETPLTSRATFALRGASGVILPELIRHFS
jgi:NAD-dependent SIR2 family protein deacetylase